MYLCKAQNQNLFWVPAEISVALALGKVIKWINCFKSSLVFPLQPAAPRKLLSCYWNSDECALTDYAVYEANKISVYLFITDHKKIKKS